MESINYTQTRENFAQILDEVANEGKLYSIYRKGEQKAVLMSADEYSSLMTTLHLLRSPRNAKRLYDALEEAEKDELPTQTVEELREETEGVKAH